MTNSYNAEGYVSPTEYEAFTRIEKAEKAYRPLVYICSPFSGDTETNTEKARNYCRFAVRCGCIPLAPHLLFPQFMDDTIPAERELAMRMNAVLLGKCEQLWVFGKRISTGMAAEIEQAQKWHKPIRYFTWDLEDIHGK